MIFLLLFAGWKNLNDRKFLAKKGRLSSSLEVASDSKKFFILIFKNVLKNQNLKIKSVKIIAVHPVKKRGKVVIKRPPEKPTGKWKFAQSKHTYSGGLTNKPSVYCKRIFIDCFNDWNKGWFQLIDQPKDGDFEKIFIKSGDIIFAGSGLSHLIYDLSHDLRMKQKRLHDRLQSLKVDDSALVKQEITSIAREILERYSRKVNYYDYSLPLTISVVF